MQKASNVLFNLSLLALPSYPISLKGLGHAILGHALGHAILGHALGYAILGHALGHAILGHALGHTILGNFSTDQIVIELTKI